MTGTCVYFENKSNFDSCMFDTMSDMMMKEVGCTVPWVDNPDNICKDFEKSKKAFEVYQEHRRNQQDICPNSCLFTNMYFGPPATGNRSLDKANTGQAIFYFRRDIKITEEYYLYSFLSMVAEIGGYVGLLLGASLVNIGRINSFLLDICVGKDPDSPFDKSPEMKTRSHRVTQVAPMTDDAYLIPRRGLNIK